MSAGQTNQQVLTYAPTALTGGNSKLGQKIADPLNIFGWQSSTPQAPTLSGPPTQASGINLNPTLADTFGQIGTKQQGNIGNVYGNMRTQLAGNKSGSGVTGIAPGSYADQRLTTGQSLADQNLSAGLGSVLGNEGYQSWKNKRDFNQNMALAKYTGALNKPSLLEQALSGLSGGAQIAGMVSAGKTGNKKKSSSTSFDPYASSGADNSDYGYSDDDQYNA